ncbi:DoxX family protein [uncultured Rhodoblastus sp.]|uniref:DoxX family protein n=1 Tax=uncultured Rhodoblastus sp. TaxID=543037 RepID=UPI002600FEF2|nr:DoxX family protein [uncultured Rhodoblastus sp.]
MTHIADDFAAPTQIGANLEKLRFWGAALSQLLLRIAIAVPFFRSGLTKWDGFLRLNESTDTLFAEEFKLHLFGAEYAYPAPHVMALISGSLEIAMPILLVLGLGTRLAALVIIGMTAVIQLTVPEGWANFHLLWAATALAIVVHGPGAISLDAAIWRFFGRAHSERFLKS